MIDLHNHVVPNLDDGPKSLDVSLSMLKSAKDQGITDIVNTVHYQTPRLDGIIVEYNYVKEKISNLQDEMVKNNIPIRLHIGAEVFYFPNLFDLKDNPLLTFQNGKYMLIEFPYDQVPNGCQNTFFKLKLAGVTPIIAHPERTKPIQKDLSIVRNFIRSGCIIQVNAGSLNGTLGDAPKFAAMEIIKQGCCHIIGSDAHDNKHRNFLLKNGLDIARGIIGEKAIELVTKNPRMVLDGDPIETHVDSQPTEKKSFFQRFRRRIFS